MGKATQPPTCKICGAAHRGPCFQRPTAFVDYSEGVPMTKGNPVKPKTVDAPKRKRTESEKIATDAITLGNAAFTTDEQGRVQHVDMRKVQKSAPKPKANEIDVTEAFSPAGFDKRAYQREYMRKRRAAAKAKKESP